MEIILIIGALIVFMCILAEKFSSKIGMPALIMFMFVGMFFGCDGVFEIDYQNFEQAANICGMALAFIMFYGGFNTKWKVAKAVAVKASVLSTVGVVLTAVVMMLFCHWVLGLSMAESFLVGAVLSPTDAASVFAILRKKNVNLKYGTASLLELESGSNDPVAYMLTLLAVDMINKSGMGNIVRTVSLEIIVGAAMGVALAELCIFVLTKTEIVGEGLDAIFLIAMVILCYGATDILDGNSFLSVYLLGILVGNSKIKHMTTLVPFFDGVTSLAQIIIFFLIGLLTIPHDMVNIVGISVILAIVLTFLIRPLMILTVLIPMRCHFRQSLLVAWSGLRGASSFCFTMVAGAAGVAMKQDLFHIVFVVCLVSVILQGTLLPTVAKVLDMIDDKQDVRKTFNDYQEEVALQLMRMHIAEGHEWENKMIKDVNLPTGSLALMIKRGKETLITKGNTVIHAGDNIILNIPRYTTNEKENLKEKHIRKGHKWCGKQIGKLKLAKNVLIAMIIRGDETIIPDGKTIIYEGDVVVLYKEGKDPIEGIL